MDRISFLERLSYNFQVYASRIAISDSEDKKSMTYRDLDRVSGKVYHYLKEKKIGPEDFVMVHLTRSAAVFAVAIGILRAGAAYVICDESDPQEQVSFIYRDCGCRLKIGRSELEEIGSYEPLPGYVKCGEHTAAYASYTSGSTGYPKGVIQELGTLVNCERSFYYHGEPILSRDDVFALLSPLSFAAANIGMNPILSAGGELAIVPTGTVKRPAMLTRYFETKKVTAALVTPSLLRVFHEFGPSFRKLFIAAEQARNVFFEDITIFNFFGQTESGFNVTLFKVDREYPLTPVGKPALEESGVKILNEEGEECGPGEMGEICFRNEFFRGYIGLPEMTEHAKRGGIYHSGDIGKYDDNGNIVLLGRNDDMVKINGNRVEPAEIEQAVREELDVSWAAARVFQTGESAYICAYYKDEPGRDLDKARERIAARLPYYMVSAYYMRIDEIPVNKNGKFVRNRLPGPEAGKKNEAAEGGAPADELEESVLAAFRKVLKISDADMLDDFYEVGGDSLASIELMEELDVPGLSAMDIFRCRTARKIAGKIRSLMEEELAKEDPEARNAAAMKKEFPLGAFQTYMLDYQLYTPRSTMLNIPVFLRFGNAVDIPRLAAALQKTIEAHPALRTRIVVGENQDFAQKFFDEPVVVEPEKVSETEMIDIREGLVAPFKLIGKPLFRCRLFETEAGGYLFFDVHHIMADGLSVHVFLTDLIRAYRGRHLETDRYYLYLEKMGEEARSEEYRQDLEYFDSLYGRKEWNSCPRQDYASRENRAGAVTGDIPISGATFEQIHMELGVTNNAFFAAVALLALAEYNSADNAFMTWTYHGRDEVDEESMIALLIRDIPIGVEIDRAQTCADFLRLVQRLVNEGIGHSRCLYSLRDASIAENDRLCFLYQKDVYSLPMLRDVTFEKVELPEPYDAAENVFDVQVIDDDGRLSLSFDYASTRYCRESVERFRRIYQKIALRLARRIDEVRTIGEILA